MAKTRNSNKLLSGADLAGYIKVNQAKQAARLTSMLGRNPKLAIIQAKDLPAINTYIQVKMRYGDDIGVDVERFQIDQPQAEGTIGQLNNDDSVDGIIVQLPLAEPDQTDSVLAMIDPAKDVDGLAPGSKFDSAAATAILWLLSGYNIDLAGKKFAVIGQGRLVGKPLADYLQQSGLDVTRCDINTENLSEVVSSSDIVITAAGSPGLVKSDWLAPKTVVIDAGTSEQDGQLRGDVDPAAHERKDLLITPVKGGVGPLTVCALFDNVLTAAANHIQ